MRRIHIIETGLQATPPDDAVGLMFECAPDASFGVQSHRSFGLTELLGDFDDLKDHANALASMLLEAEPKLRGIQQLGIFRERVIAEIQTALATQHLDRKLRDEEIIEVCFAAGSQLAAGFASLQQRLPPEPAAIGKRRHKVRALSDIAERHPASAGSGFLCRGFGRRVFHRHQQARSIPALEASSFAPHHMGAG